MRIKQPWMVKGNEVLLSSGRGRIVNVTESVLGYHNVQIPAPKNTVVVHTLWVLPDGVLTARPCNPDDVAPYDFEVGTKRYG